MRLTPDAPGYFPPRPRPRPPAEGPRMVVGCMTGTSLDALDVALVRISGRGLAMRATLMRTLAHPLPASLRDRLVKIAQGTPTAALEVLEAARALGRVHARAVADLLGRAKPQAAASFVVAHGQTIWHAGDRRLSWQLFDPWPIVGGLGLDVCYDLRQADLIAGGEGAPVTPLADWVLYRRAGGEGGGGEGGDDETGGGGGGSGAQTGAVDVVVNLGGICNLTRLGERIEDVEARDVCACNLLLDAVARRVRPGTAYDQDGAMAAAGRAEDPGAFAALLSTQRRSLGREDVRWDRIAAVVDRFARGEDAAASAVQAVGRAIGAALRLGESVMLAGGGARHPGLVEAIAEHSGAVVRLSDELGIACEAREAAAFAVLGALSRDRVPITLPRVTGADRPGVAGVWAYA